MVKAPLAPPGGAMLVDLTSESRAPFAASKLWEQDPALIVKQAFEALGVKMSAVVKEDLPGEDGKPGEIAAFREGFWPDLPVYMDERLAFYEAIAGAANTKRVPKTVEGNLTGEGFVHGGCYVVRGKTGDVVLAHHEAEIGDHPAKGELLAACRKAAGMD
ncbi:prostaglandin-F synthase [Aureococcus anophagefferens]|nr:prostaglandin-F synthase [Aureococcus anophagefferens]